MWTTQLTQHIVRFAGCRLQVHFRLLHPLRRIGRDKVCEALTNHAELDKTSSNWQTISGFLSELQASP